MKRLVLVFVSLLAVISNTPARAGFLLDLDRAVFRADDSLGFVEVYVAVQRANLIHVTVGDSSRADFAVVLDVMQDTTVVLSDTLSGHDAFHANEPSSAGQFFPLVFQMIVKPGRYGLRASIYQQYPEARDVVLDTLLVGVIPSRRLTTSDLELGCDLGFGESPSRFTKNGVRLLPNPTRFYGTALPLLCYYVEVYGLDSDSLSADSFRVLRRVVDAQSGASARADVERRYRAQSQTAVVADGFPVTTLRTGTYYVELEVRFKEVVTYVRKKFWTYRKEDFAAGRQVATTPDFGARLMAFESNAVELLDPDSALQWMHYILDRSEHKRIERLTVDGKREFLRNFWVEREKGNPGAANQFFARVAESNRRFSYLNRQGWKTDRGRVLVLYGEPDHVTRNYATPQMPDNEVWEYNRLEGGVYFVFLDRAGFGDLDLVHSTKRGEIYNPRWQELIPTNYRRPGQSSPFEVR